MTKEMTKEDFEKLEKLEKQKLIAMYHDALLQIEELKERNSEMGWRLNPDRMGGQFTQEEINRGNEWR